MKIILFFILCGAVSAQVVWKNCGDDTYKGTIDSFTSDPDPPKKRVNVSMIGTGKVSVDITKANWIMTITVDGIQFVQQVGDACIGQKVKFPFDAGSIWMPSLGCPYKAGSEVSVHLFVKMTPLVPPGPVNTTFNVYNKDDGNLLCLNVQFKT